MFNCFIKRLAGYYLFFLLFSFSAFSQPPCENDNEMKILSGLLKLKNTNHEFMSNVYEKYGKVLGDKVFEEHKFMDKAPGGIVDKNTFYWFIKLLHKTKFNNSDELLITLFYDAHSPEIEKNKELKFLSEALLVHAFPTFKTTPLFFSEQHMEDTKKYFIDNKSYFIKRFVEISKTPEMLAKLIYEITYDKIFKDKQFLIFGQDNPDRFTKYKISAHSEPNSNKLFNDTFTKNMTAVELSDFLKNELTLSNDHTIHIDACDAAMSFNSTTINLTEDEIKGKILDQSLTDFLFNIEDNNGYSFVHYLSDEIEKQRFKNISIFASVADIIVYPNYGYKRDPNTKQLIEVFGEIGQVHDIIGKEISINLDETMVKITLD